MITPLPDLLIAPIVRAALAEDLGRAGDVTSQAGVPAEARLSVIWAARRPGVLAGLDCARLALAELAPEARFNALARDGDTLSPGQVLARAEAPARAVLAAERTGLNLMGRLSGIATLTRAYVEAVAGTGVRITDTRKTTPGLRQLEKYAVRCGGGTNHRMGLYDRVMVKDNHLMAGTTRKDLPRLIERFSAEHPGVIVELEADTLEQVAEFLTIRGVGIILLDNMSCEEMRKAPNLTSVLCSARYSDPSSWDL